jgi:hypothetical protein
MPRRDVWQHGGRRREGTRQLSEDEAAELVAKIQKF